MFVSLVVVRSAASATLRRSDQGDRLSGKTIYLVCRVYEMVQSVDATLARSVLSTSSPNPCFFLVALTVSATLS